MAGSLAHAPLYAKRTMLRMHAGLNRQLARCMRAAGGSDALRKGALGLRLSLSMFMLSCLQSCAGRQADSCASAHQQQGASDEPLAEPVLCVTSMSHMSDCSVW